MISVVVGQIAVTWSVKRNVAAVLDAIEATGPGALLVLPEAALSGYDDELSGLDSLDPAGLERARSTIHSVAAARGVHVLCGSLHFEDDRWWNAAFYFAPGERPWIYRKVNLATHERGRLAAGSVLPTVRMALGGHEIRGGVQLCREIRFPEQWSCLARQGAQVLFYLTYAANPRELPGVWRAHLISRAAETQRFLVAANVAHPQQHCPSMVISPRGEVLAEAAPGSPVLLRHSFDTAAVRDDYLRQRRDDVVRNSLAQADRDR